ncbi:diaminopimelate decarboxylase [soil metagenome]
MKSGFTYSGGKLHVDGVSVAKLAEEFGTPLYVYSGATLRENYRRIAKTFAKANCMVAYSVKSNSNLGVLALLDDEGAGFDIVSGGELERVRRIGVKGDRIIFAGVGKTEAEMREALKANVHEFNLESEAEAERLNTIAGAMKKRAAVAIRMNPNIDAKTHKYITTGKKENKFGISMARTLALSKHIVKNLKHLELIGLHCHVGSQILDSTIHPRIVSVFIAFAERVMKETGVQLKNLNFGGGFGVAYTKDQKQLDLKPFAAAVIPELKRLGARLLLEPGRSISASAGALLTTVEYVKPGDSRTFAVLDASMTELIRPTLYEAYHEILPVTKRRGKNVKVDFVGPVCESGDFLALDRAAQLPAQGDVLAIMDAGAYGFVMASHYNTRTNPAEVLIDGGKVHLVRKRETYNDLLKHETVPRKK